MAQLLLPCGTGLNPSLAPKKRARGYRKPLFGRWFRIFHRKIVTLVVTIIYPSAKRPGEPWVYVQKPKGFKNPRSHDRI